MTKRVCSDSLPSTLISCKRVTLQIQKDIKPTRPNKFMVDALRIFSEDKDLKTTTESLLSLASTLSLVEASKVLHRRDSQDILQLSNTLPHYVVFYYGKKMRHAVSGKERCMIGKSMLHVIQYFVSNFNYNVFTKNSDGASVYSYVTRNPLFSTSAVAAEMSQTVLHKLQNEIRVLKQFLYPVYDSSNHSSRRLGCCVFLKRMSVSSDIQRKIKILRFKLTLESWNNSSNIYKLMAVSCLKSLQ